MCTLLVLSDWLHVLFLFPRLRARQFKASPDELYISEDVCASVIYESKKAVSRCKEVREINLNGSLK